MAPYTPQKKHAPLDPDVVIPAAIRASAARSDALHKAAYSGDAPVVETTPGDGNKQVPANDVVTPAPAPEAAATPAPTPAPAAQGDDWQHKYNSLKGRFDAQEAVINSQNARLRNLEGMLAASAATAPTPAELKFKPITDKDIEEYSPEFIDLAKRAAAEALVPEIKTLRDTVSSLQNAVGAQAEGARSRTKAETYAYLDNKMPNWRVLNKDENFKAWAGLPDPMSGVIRMALMRDALENGDADRVLRFFNGYLAEAAPTPATPTPPGNGKVSLEQFAAPGRASAPAAAHAEPGVDEEIISHAQIAAFYAAVARGDYRGNEKDKNELEARIFAAQAAGRVR